MSEFIEVVKKLSETKLDYFSPKNVASLFDVTWERGLEICQQGEIEGLWTRITRHGYFYQLTEKENK